MSVYYYTTQYDDYLMHHGIKNQKWGIRRFQNEDGSLTPEGMKRYGRSEYYDKKISKADAKSRKAANEGKNIKSRFYQKRSKLYKQEKDELNNKLESVKDISDARLEKRKSHLRNKNNEHYTYEEYRDKYWADKMRDRDKSGKEKMYEYAADKRDRVRKEKNEKITKANERDLDLDFGKGVLRTLTGYEDMRPMGSRSTNTAFERYGNKVTDFDNRLETRFTFDKTLRDMKPHEAYQYVNNKRNLSQRR